MLKYVFFRQPESYAAIIATFIVNKGKHSLRGGTQLIILIGKLFFLNRIERLSSMKLRFSSVIRLSAISFIALGLAACSSGSGVPLDAGVGGGGSGGGMGGGTTTGKPEVSKPKVIPSSVDEVPEEDRQKVREAKGENGTTTVLDIVKDQLRQDGSYSEDELSKLTYIRQKSDGKEVKGDEIFKIPESGLNIDNTETLNFGNGTVIERKIRLYEQPYSTVSGYVNKKVIRDGKEDDQASNLDVLNLTFSDITGLKTTQEQLEKLPNVKATYIGKAFDSSQDDEGDLTYTIDFENKTGEGHIKNLHLLGGSGSYVDLEKANITSFSKGTESVYGVNPEEGRAIWANKKATANPEHGYYGFVLYGPKANEIAGAIYADKPGKDIKAVVGFGGSTKDTVQ